MNQPRAVRLSDVAPSEFRGNQFSWKTETLPSGRRIIELCGSQQCAGAGYWIYAPNTALEAAQSIEHTRRKLWASAEVLAGLVNAIFNNLDTHAIYPPSSDRILH